MACRVRTGTQHPCSLAPLIVSRWLAVCADDKTIRMWEYGIQAQAIYIAGGR